MLLLSGHSPRLAPTLSGSWWKSVTLHVKLKFQKSSRPIENVELDRVYDVNVRLYSKAL